MLESLPREDDAITHFLFGSISTFHIPQLLNVVREAAEAAAEVPAEAGAFPAAKDGDLLIVVAAHGTFLNATGPLVMILLRCL